MLLPAGITLNRVSHIALGGGAPPAPLIAPSGSWNGTAGSGGTPPTQTGTAIPVQPEYGSMLGTVAPVMHWIKPLVSDMPFFDDYTVIVTAACASASGGMKLDEAVTFWCEGTEVVGQFGLWPIAGWNGATRYVIGHAVKLDHSAFSTNGQALLYATCDPSLAGLTTRVIGPMRVSRLTDYTLTLDIAPSQSVITGSRYQSVQAALAYLIANGVSGGQYRLRCTENVTLTEAISFTNGSSATNARRGQTVIDANGFTCIAQRSAGFANIRPQYNGLVWKGWKFDVAKVLQILAESGSTGTETFRLMQFIDCEFYSGNGAGEMPGSTGTGLTPRGSSPIGGQVAIESSYLHDFSPGGGNQSFRAVGCDWENIIGDTLSWGVLSPATGCFNRICYANRFNFVSGSVFRNRLQPFTLSYSGAGVATYDCTGTANTNTRALVLKVDGSTVRTITASTTEGSGIYTMQNAVDDINTNLGASGWTATLLDNTRRFASIFASNTLIVGQASSNNALSVNLAAAFDIHCDGVQMQNGSTHENILVANNLWRRSECQILFPSLQTTAGDNIAIYQNGGHILPDGDLAEVATLRSQTSGLLKHFIYAQNTLPNQKQIIRRGTVSPQGTFDDFSRFLNNVAVNYDMLTTGSAVTWDIYASGNIGFAAPDTTAFTGTNVTTPTVSGTAVLNYPNVDVNGFVFADFIPASGQSVRNNPATSYIGWDVFGTARGSTAPPGVAA